MSDLARTYVCAAILLLIAAWSLPASAQQWELAPGMPSARYDMAAVELGGSIYVIGGLELGSGRRERAVTSVIQYDSDARAWTPVASLLEARHDAAAVVLEGLIYLVGGADGDDEATDDVLIYDPAADQWTEGEDLQFERRGHEAVVLGGRILVAGGVDDDGKLLRDVEAFDPANGEWTVVEEWSLNYPRVSFAMVALNEEVHIFGGLGEGSVFEPVQRAEVLLPGQVPKVVVPPADVFTPRGYLASAVSGNSAFFLGGADRRGTVSDVVTFTPSSPVPWRRGRPMRTPRKRFAAVTVDGNLYAIGGLRDRQDGDLPLQSVELMQVGTDIERPDELPPLAIHLEQNYPNPFTESTTISFEVQGNGLEHVSVDVYDLMGRRLRTLVRGPMAPGRHEVVWRGTAEDGRRVGSGNFACVLQTESGRTVRMMTRVR